MQAQWKANPETDTSDVISGTIIIAATMLAPEPTPYTLDYTPLLAAKPVQRYGNLMVYRGTFTLSGPRAARFADRALDAELGNIRLQRGKRDDAVQAYENARTNAPAGDEIIPLLTRQIQRVSQEDLKSVALLRNPVLE
jgi:hypothetical protein